MDFSQLNLGNGGGFEEWPYHYYIDAKIFSKDKNGNTKPLCICQEDEKTGDPIFAGIRKRYGFQIGNFAVCPNKDEDVAFEVEDISNCIMKPSASFDSLCLRIPICYQQNHTKFHDGEDEEYDETGNSLEEISQNNMCVSKYGQGLLVFVPKSGEFKGQLCAKCCYCSQKTTHNQGLFPLGSIKENEKFLYSPEEIASNSKLEEKINAKVEAWWSAQSERKQKTTKAFKRKIIPKKKKTEVNEKKVDEEEEYEEEEDEEIVPVKKVPKKIPTVLKVGGPKMGGFS